MNGNTRRDALRRLADELVEDILAATDEELLAEVAEDQEDPEKIAADMRRLFEQAENEVGKAKMAAARAAVDADRQRFATVVKLDPAEARRRLALALESNPDMAKKLTLAARKGEKLSDNDVRAILEDLEQLGIFPRSDDEDRKP
jgi:hypothetical protein